jgi:hypothetical protein
MATKSKTAVPKPKAVQYPRKSAQVLYEATDSETEKARKYAAVVTSPALAAYRVISGAEAKSGIGESIDVPALMDQLRAQGEAVNRGDLAQAEAMLMNQATALQSLFARLAERGMGCELAPAFEANMRMALRAQAQCRATLETLSTIKNPPVIFAKTSERDNRAATNQQRHSAHARKRNRAKQTIRG